jgi:hypothetical protein
MSRTKKPGSRRRSVAGDRLRCAERNRLTKSGKIWRFGTIGCSCTLLAAIPLYASSDRWGWLGCPIRKLVGIPCPSCGMTRSLISLVRGDWLAALQYHAFGPFLFAGLILLGIHATMELVRDRPLRTFYTSLFDNRKLQLFLLLLFAIYYSLRLVNIIPSNYL